MLAHWSRAVLNCGSLGRVYVPPVVEQPVAQRRHTAVIESEMTKRSLFIAKFHSPPKTGGSSLVQFVTACHALIFNCGVRAAAFLGCRQPGNMHLGMCDYLPDRLQPELI
jgi:hypothetical protein